MNASELVVKVARDLGDYESGHEFARWKAADLLEYLTDAMRVVVLLRPDANAVTVPVLLATGSTRQTIPPDGARFLCLVRNMGDGQTPGLPITPIKREDLDAANQGWHDDAFSAVVDHYVYDDAVPTVFYVSPPPAAGLYVDLSYARLPQPVPALDSEIPLSGIWSEPLREYMMYRAYTRNDSSADDLGKGERHLSRFFTVLGEESKAKLVFSPNFNRDGGQTR
ncbi:MAG: hypothetical protein HY916_09135 [Desulfovibrio sp.]|jgi:hypothetical protein|nr:hypothetical protein [Desulfovibrio sp.]